MPFFKRKPGESDDSKRSTRLEELEAHVKAIRGAAGGPNANRFNSLDAFLVEDQWPGQQQMPPIKPPPPDVAKSTPPPAEAGEAGSEEAMLMAELQRYMAEHPEPGDTDEEPGPVYPESPRP